jgi:protein FAM32A
MSDAYSNVVGGSLKLKGKKSGKKRKHAEAAAPTQAADADEVAALASAAAAAAEAEAGAPSDRGADATSSLTKAQRDYVRAHERNARRKGEAEKGKTYRDRISAMNEYLSNLSEHHDVPRITKH